MFFLVVTSTVLIAQTENRKFVLEKKMSYLLIFSQAKIPLGFQALSCFSCLKGHRHARFIEGSLSTCMLCLRNSKRPRLLVFDLA